MGEQRLCTEVLDNRSQPELLSSEQKRASRGRGGGVCDLLIDLIVVSVSTYVVDITRHN